MVRLSFNGGILQGLPPVSRKKEGGDTFTSSQASTIISKQITPKASVSYFFCISDPYLQLVCWVVALNAPPALQKSTFLKMNSSVFPGGCQWSHAVHPPTLTPNPVHQILSFPCLSAFSPFCPHCHGFHSASQPVGYFPYTDCLFPAECLPLSLFSQIKASNRPGPCYIPTPYGTSFQVDKTKGQVRQRLAFKRHLCPTKAVQILKKVFKLFECRSLFSHGGVITCYTPGC